MNEHFKLDELKEFARRNNYEYCEDGGQIILTGPSNLKQSISRNSEVFIGKIPKDIDFRRLISLFSQVGSIYMFRIMINFSGFNRGYAFAQYLNEEDANQAIIKFNNFELNSNYKIVVTKSKNNCRLYVGRIDSTLTNSDVENFFRELTPDIQNIYIHRNKTQNLQFFYAFLQYDNHRDAAKARRILKERELKLKNHVLKVDWATLHNESYVNNDHFNEFRSNDNQIKLNNNDLNTPISNSTQQLKGQMINSLVKNLTNYWDSMMIESPRQFSNQLSNQFLRPPFSNQFSNETTLDNNQFSNQSLRSFNNLSSFQFSTPANYQSSNESRRQLSNQFTNQLSRPFDNHQPFSYSSNESMRPFDNRSSGQLSRQFDSSNDNMILYLTNVRHDVDIEDIKTILKVDHFEIIKLERERNLIIIYLDSPFPDIFIEIFNEIQDKFSLLFGESNKICELYFKQNSSLSSRDDFKSLNDSFFSMNLNRKF